MSAAQGSRIRALLVEDSEQDAHTLLRILEHDGVILDASRVDSESGLVHELQSMRWDIAIVDYYVPGMNAHETLRTIRANDPHLPVVIVTGAVGEETAVELMRAGADDCVLKSNFARMAAAIQRSVRDGLARRERFAGLEMLRQSEERFRVTFEHALVGLAHLDSDGVILRANGLFAELTGRLAHELRGTQYADLLPPDDRTAERHAIEALFSRGETRPSERRIRRSDGTYVWVARSMGLAGEGGEYAVLALQDVTARKLGEEALRMSERRFRFLTEQASDGIVLIGGDGVVREANQQAAELLALGRSSLVGMRAEHLPGLDQRSAARTTMNPGETTLWEGEIQRGDGSRAYVEISARAVEGGGLLAIIRDATMRHHHHLSLVSSDELFRLVSRATSDGIYDWRIDQNELWTNDGFRAMFGHPAPDSSYVSIEWWESNIHPDDRAAAMASLDRAIEDGSERWSFEYRFRRSDGTYADVVDRGTFIRDEGRAVRMVGSMLDVTEAREVERALRESESRFRTVIEMIEDLIGIADEEGRLIFASPSIERRLQRTHDELIGSRVIDFVHPDDRERITRILDDLFRNGGRARAEFRVRDASGMYRIMEGLAVNAVHEPAIGGVLVTCRDVTARRFLEAQVAKADKLASLGRLTANVAHEFNNVLMGILPFVELIRRSSSDDTLLRAVTRIERSVERGRRVSHDLLSFTQPASPEPVEIDLCEWIPANRDSLQALLGSGFDLETQIEIDSAIVFCDEREIRQALEQVVINARDAMSAGGVIRIGLRRTAEDGIYPFGIVSDPRRSIELFVCDEGPGIPPNVIEQVMEPLFTTKGSATGLGLTIANQNIIRNGGQLLIESEPERGCNVHFFLPMSISRDAAHPEAPLRILMVEDDEIIAGGISAFLALESFEVDIAHTAARAHQLLSQRTYDLVIMDMSLPDGDGSELLAWLDRNGITTPVIRSSGGTAPPLRYTSAMPVADLAKPYSMADLLQTIRSLLQVDRR